MTVTIWHNPRCGKSRQTLELLRRNCGKPVIREYLDEPPTKADIASAIVAHPILLQRPIVVSGRRAAICRPEAVLPLLT